MVTKYVGVFCIRCKRFMVQSSHEVERPEIIGANLDISPVTDLRCEHCGEVCGYRQENVAHSTSPDGTNTQYPHRRQAAGN